MGNCLALGLECHLCHKKIKSHAWRGPSASGDGFAVGNWLASAPSFLLRDGRGNSIFIFPPLVKYFNTNAPNLLTL
jgi:hypothetical protein